MKKRLVLHVSESLDFGGVEAHMNVIGGNSQRSRFRHSFCSISRGGAVGARMAESGNSVAILNCPSRIPSLAATFALMRQIRKTNPEIIHCHGAEANFHGIIAGKICRVPVCIAEEIGFPNHSLRARLVFRWIYRMANSVVAISEAVKRKIVELGEVEAARCQVILNPVQMLSRRRDPPPSDQFRLGFVGRLEEVKNPLGLIKAVRILRSRGLQVCLTIVGDGSQRKMLEDEVKKFGLFDSVFLVGFAPRPFERLADIDLYVQPSISEGFGLALVEAMSMGIPVLATPVGGTPEIIDDEENGWLLSGTSAESIADAIEALVAADVAMLRAIGGKGRDSVIQRFSPDAYFMECDKFYERFIAAIGA
ncbi:glycosyltransferase [bacterium]|nr:glycosyltransferase [bacterium]